MGQKIVVGPINKGLRNDRTAFVIDNDSFPFLVNAYQWRGRVKRKRGTAFLGRLSRFLGTTDPVTGNFTVAILPKPIGTGITSFVIGTDVFVDPGTTANPGVQTLLTNSAGSGTLDRVSGTLTITGSQPSTAVIYYPSLPVMGLEDLALVPTQFPGTLAFDTTYAYNINTQTPYNIYDVSFYKNPAVDGTNLPGYVPKSVWTPTTWNGKDYQQFWSVNYQGALWVTNGIDIGPTTLNQIGMQFRKIENLVGIPPGPFWEVQITITGHGLVQGDFLFFNEVQGTTGINFQTGYVISPDPQDPNSVTVALPFASLGGVYTKPSGIVQYLTNRSDSTKDCIRWYDGDPTNTTLTSQSFVLGNGWVNFSPPISQSTNTIADLSSANYYLVGCRLIIPFKDRLLFIGPVVQSSTSSPIYLQDTVIYSQNGTPYYTASFNGSVITPLNNHAILTPVNQTAFPSAYFDDVTGFGGFIQAGISQPITTVASNEDSLIMGFSTLQTRFLYTGNDIIPFNFYIINAELGSSSTFSIVTLDQGVITRGTRGFIITGQTSARRIDLDIPDQVFQISNKNNGTERMCSQRDFINEWVYFTYPSNQVSYSFPNQTLQYNYRDDSWAIFNESYTTYGTFRQTTGLTWNTLPKTLTWETWNTPWNSGSSSIDEPVVIAGNTQGFVVFRASNEAGTSEATSLTIQNIVGNIVTSPNHTLNPNDYIMITGVLGTIGSQVNGKIFQVQSPTTNAFFLNDSSLSGTYQGGGLIIRMYVPFIQSKQFPVAWEMSRKTRIGPQQYLLTTTDDAQIQLLIFLSQNFIGDAIQAYNNTTINPDPASLNNSLIYSSVLYTCPESTNIGLTPANMNLQMPTAADQQQIWHRMNTSLIGDTVQVGFTLSDSQMTEVDDNGNPISQFAEIELHAMILDVSPSQVLA